MSHTTLYTGDHNGTSLRGYITTTYSTLVEKLGHPTKGPSADGKVTVSWEGVIEGTDEMYTIYDWKQSRTPVGEYDWHIGGRSSGVVTGLGRQLGLEDKTRRWDY